MIDNNTLINQTQKWLSNVIIKHTLCPFAKHEHDNGRIYYQVIEAAHLHSQLEQIAAQFTALDTDAKRETSLLIFPLGLSEFENYLDFLGTAEDLLEQQGYEGIYQLASFHPNYRFAGASRDDPSNYTNRSPYPMVHILRESSVEVALMNYSNPEKIPERNIRLTKELGLKAMKALLAESYK